jgi:Cu-processing system permease protein
MRPILSLFRYELGAARRGRTVPLFAAGFAVTSVAVALIGLSAGGVLAVQGFARTSVSLLQLVVWVVPMLALLTGAVVGAECHELELVAALPVRRADIVLTRWMAWTIALGGALLVGLGAAGVAIALLAGEADGWRYLRLIGVAELVLAATVSLGMLLGIMARSRLRAVGIAVTVWFGLVIGLDLAAIGALALLPPGRAGWPLSVLLMLDPVDSARVLGLSLFQSDVVAGPTGSALRRVLGGAGAWALAGAMALWTAVPLAIAGRQFRRRDL